MKEALNLKWSNTQSYILLMAVLFVVSSCKGGGAESEGGVSIKTSEIFNKATVSIDFPLELGDIITGSSSVEYTITVRNNSNFTYTDLGVAFKVNGDGFNYNKDREGADPGFPGFEGSCSQTLASKSECTIRMEYSPLRSGVFEFPFIVKFKNLVEEESYPLKLTATAGLPANLTFQTGESQNNMGAVEQTDQNVKSTFFMIKNTGGLSARNIDIELIEDLSDSEKGYSFKNVNCPSYMKSGDTCEVRVDFVPKNNGNTDPEVEYSSNLKFSYNNEPNSSRLGYLNAYFSALSTKIQGVLTAPASIKEYSYIDKDGYTEITVGKTLSSSFKVSNTGFEKAQVREILIYDNDTNNDLSDDILLARCLQDLAGFNCFKPDFSGGRELISKSNDKFPWEILDTNNCIGGEISAAPPGSTLGGACIFDIKFHPSVMTYYEKDLVSGVLEFDRTTSNNELKLKKRFDNIRLEFLYDSFWKTYVCDDESTYLTSSKSLSCINEKSMFKLSAGTQSAGVLRIKSDELTYGLEKITPFENGRIDPTEVEDNYYYYDIGRRALVLDEDYSTKISFTVENNGFTPLRITKVYMYDQNDNQVILHAGNSYNNISEYFRNVTTTCNKDYVLSLGETCQFESNFLPLFINEAGFDYTNYFYDTGKDYRSIFFEYNDGTCLEDSGSGSGYTDDEDHEYCSEEKSGLKRSKRVVEFRMKGTLIQKGMLAFSKDLSAVNTGNIHYDYVEDGFKFGKGSSRVVPGDNTKFHEVKITNVGTGPIPYIKFRQFNPAYNNNPDTYLMKPTVPTFPFEFRPINDVARKDCLDIIDRKSFSEETLDSNSNPSSFLFDTFEFMKNGSDIPDRLNSNDLSLISRVKNRTNATHLDSGDSCYLRIQLAQKEEAKSVVYGHANDPSSFLLQLHKEKVSDIDSSKRAYDLKVYRPWGQESDSIELSFEYFNGDASAEDDEQTIVGLGSLETITGPEGFDVFKVNANHSSLGKILPVSITPFQSGVIYRPSFYVTEIPYDPSFFSSEPADYSNLTQDDNKAFELSYLNELFIHHESRSLAPSESEGNLIYRYLNIKNNAKSLRLSHQEGDGTPLFEYFVNFGTFEDGLIHNGLSFTLSRSGQFSNSSVTFDADSGTIDNPACGLDVISGLQDTANHFTFSPVFPDGVDVLVCKRVIKVSYNNGVILNNLTEETDSYKILLVAEARRGSSTPKTSYKYKNYEADGSAIFPEAWNSFTVGTGNDTSLTSSLDFNSIVESGEVAGTRGEFFAKKTIELSSLVGSADVSNISFYFKPSIGEGESDTYKRTDSYIVNNGIAILNESNCTASGVSSGGSCEFDIVYNPGTASMSSADTYLIIAYDIKSGVEEGLPVVQRVEKSVHLTFTASFPANTSAVPSPDYEVQVAGNGVDQRIMVNYRDIQLISSDEVTFSNAKTVSVKNTKALSASMCRQWQIHQYESFSINQDTNNYFQNQKTFVNGISELNGHGDYSIDVKKGLVHTYSPISTGHTVILNISYKDKPNELVTLSEGERKHEVSYPNTKCSPTFDDGFATILETDKFKISAYSKCFFGDSPADELDTSLGFLQEKICDLKTYYKANFRDIYYANRTLKYGYEVRDNMNDQCETIQYYSYNREIKSSKNIEICGNAVVYPENNGTPKTDENWKNISSGYVDGKVQISLEVEEADYDSGTVWGPVVGYALYIKPKASSLLKIYRDEFQEITPTSITDTSGASFFKVLDVGSGSPGYTFAQLNKRPDGSFFTPGVYYDFQIFSIRELDGVRYLSDMGYNIISILSPPVGTFYDYERNKLLDNEPLKDNSGSAYDSFSRSDAIAKCGISKYNLTRKGLPITIPKKLFTSSEIELIKENIAQANDYDYWLFPHWLGDPKRNIEQLWNAHTTDPFDNDVNSNAGCIGPQYGLCGEREYLPLDPTPEAASFMYVRECGDHISCNQLYSAYGGLNFDNQDLFINDDALEFHARCWAELPLN